MIADRSVTGSVEMMIPRITELHSASWIESREGLDASALPHTLDMSAWLSLVGKPLREARVAQRITVSKETKGGLIAIFGLFPKPPIP
jgi:hypothetical protein